MNAVIALCHFCEAHGPSAIFCTQTLRDTKLEELQLNQQQVENKLCSACNSLGQTNGMYSKDNESGATFLSTQAAALPDVQLLIKQAAVRSLSCEINSNKDGGFVFFGDSSRGHVLSHTFQVNDLQARGFYQLFSIIVLMKDKYFLLNTKPFLAEHLRKISADIQASAKKINDETKELPRQRRLSSAQVLVQTPRSLVELTGEENIFAFLHSHFSWILLAGSRFLTEHVTFGNLPWLPPQSSDRPPQQRLTYNITLPMLQKYEETINDPEREEFYSLRHVKEVVRREFNTIVYCALTGETRIRGKSQCFEIDQEICTVLPMLFVNKYPLIIPTQLSQQVLANAKPVVIVPLLNPPLNNGDEVLPPLIAPIIKPLLIAPLPPLTPTTPSTTITTTTTASSTLTTTAETHTGEQVATLEAPTSTLETNETGGIQDLAAGVGNIHPSEGINVNANSTITAAPNTTKDKPNAVDFNNNTMETHADKGDVAVDEKAPAATGDLGIQATAAAHEGTLQTAHAISELTKIVGAPAVVAPPPPTVLDEVLVGKPLPPETASLAPPTEYATVEYIPNLDEFLPGNRPPPNVLEEDSNSNSVHEEFPSVVLADLDNAPQSLLTPDEPPENP